MVRDALSLNSGGREVICLDDSSTDDNNDGNHENENLFEKNTNGEKLNNDNNKDQQFHKNIEIHEDDKDTFSNDSSHSTVTINGISKSLMQPSEIKTKSISTPNKPLSPQEVEILSLSDDESIQDIKNLEDSKEKVTTCENSRTLYQKDHKYSRSIDSQEKQQKRAKLTSCESVKYDGKISSKKKKIKNDIYDSFSDSDDEFLDPHFSLFEKKKSNPSFRNNITHSTINIRQSSNSTTTNTSIQNNTKNGITNSSTKMPSIKVKSDVCDTSVICIDDSIITESDHDNPNLHASKPIEDFDNGSTVKYNSKSHNFFSSKYDTTPKKTKHKAQPTEILILSFSDEESNENEDFSSLNETPKPIRTIYGDSLTKSIEKNIPHKENNSVGTSSTCQLNPLKKYQIMQNTNYETIWSPESIDPNTMTFADLKSPFATSPKSNSNGTNRDTSIGTNILNELSQVSEKIQTPELPTLYQVGGKLYPELRHQFIKALYSHALRNRHAAHQRCTFEITIRAIIILSLRDTPIRTPYVLGRMRGVGSELLKVVQESEKQGRKGTPYIPPRGKFSSVAPATLVALLENEKELEHKGIDKNDRQCCTAENLLKKIQPLVDFGRRRGFNQPIAYYLDKDTLDPDWAQIKKLSSSNINADLNQLIKQRSRKHLSPSGIAFELLPEGRVLATSLQKLLNKPPPPLYGPLRQLASITTNREFESVTMCIDFREGGGGTNSLHKMCNLLDDHLVPYVVRELKISDYIFFVGDKLAPILIERKNVDDVASSLSDGRWERQQRNMRMAQHILGGIERKCQICYLIEGDVNRRTVHGGNVGRRSWDQSVEDVQNAIAELPKLGFSVMSSRSIMGSMKILAKIASDVSWKSKNNSIDCSLTYDEFLTKMRTCNRKEGDPPTSSEHQYPAAPVVTPSLYTSVANPTSVSNSVQMNHSTTQNSSVAPSDMLMSPLQENLNNCPIQNDETARIDTENNKEVKELNGLTIAELKLKCRERDEKISGSKKDLVDRLLQPRKPEILIIRSRSRQYTPKVPSCNAALMIALLLNQKKGDSGVSKEHLMMLAEETGVSKDPMDGDGGFYDGWSGMKDLTTGDPALVFVSKKRYSLTTQPIGSSGVDVAKALHILAHRQGICRCNKYVPLA